MPEALGLRRVLGLGDLVLFNIAAVVGIRWLAAAAHVGPAALPLWLVAAVAFFVPSALVVTSLARRFPEEGGIYVWTREAFGDWHGFLCAYCYWLNNLFYFPSLVLAGVTMAGAIAEGGSWNPNRWQTVAAAGAAMLVATWMNVRGLAVGKWIGNLGGVCTYLAFATLAVAALWLAVTVGTKNSLAGVTEIGWGRLNFLSQIAFAFGGLELGAVLAGEVRDPRRTVPRAAWISGGAIALFYLLGTAAMLVILPADKVDVVSGLTQAAREASNATRAPAIFGVVWFCVTAGILGQLGAWVAGTSRLPMVLGADHFLPEAFSRLHPKWGTPSVSLWTQAAACCAFLLVAQMGESFHAGYQLLVDMAVITYFIPFLYLFLSAWRFGERLPVIPGLAVTALAIVVAFVPPDGAASAVQFWAKLAGGTGVVLLAGWLWFRYRTSVPNAA